MSAQPPSQNRFKSGSWPPKGASAAQLRNIMRARSQVYNGLVKEWRRRLLGPAAEAGIHCAEPASRRRITFTRLLGPRNRVFDYGNLVGGMKPVVDACVHLGLLADDDPKHFEGYYHQRRAADPGDSGLLVTVEELAPAGGEIGENIG